MTAMEDCWGNRWTTENEEAVRAWESAVTGYLGMRVDTGDRLKQAFAADPEMPIALITRGYFGKFFARPQFDAMASKSADAARKAMADRGATQTERAHLAALDDWIAGDMRAAIARWNAILVDNPQDVMAAKLVQYCNFYLGDGPAMRDALGRILHAWRETTPGYGFILGSYAFALEESGDYERAEAAGRKAVEINPADVWATHAVAHVLEMQGRAREGDAFMAAHEPHWGDIHNFRHHAQWHRALFLLELGEYDAVLSHYDAKVWTDEVEDYLDISNGAAMLWRLAEEGVDVGDRWQSVAEKCADRTADHKLVFADLHYLLALLEAGRKDEAAELRRSLGDYASRGETESEVAQKVGLDLSDAIEAIVDGRPGDAVERMMPIRGEIRLIGGSHAQRDLFDRMLVSAAIADGRLALARALLSERTEYRPASRWNWRRTADVLDRLGAAEDAAAARSRAEDLLAR